MPLYTARYVCNTDTNGFLLVCEGEVKMMQKVKKYLSSIRHVVQLIICNQVPVRYSKSLVFPHPIGIVIGSEAEIARNVVIYQNVTIGRKTLYESSGAGYPIIEENVVIYAGAVVAGGIRVGANSIIGANAVVTKDVPAGSMVVGINNTRKL